MLPSFARVAARPACRLPVAALIARRAMATGPSGAAGDLLQATLGTDARPPSTPTGTASPSSLDAAASTSSSTPADASAGVDANLYGPRDFYGASTSTSSSPSSFSSSFLDPSAAHDGADRFDSATVPYAPSAIPQTSDPLCDFWVGLNMTHGNKLKATIFLSKILDAIARQTDSPPLPIFRAAIIAASPLCRLKSIRKGAKTMIVPIPLNERQRTRFGIRWILKAADKRSAVKGEKRIAMELLAVLDGSSNVLRMVDERHKVAMMNRSNLPKDIGP